MQGVILGCLSCNEQLVWLHQPCPAAVFPVSFLWSGFAFQLLLLYWRAQLPVTPRDGLQPVLGPDLSSGGFSTWGSGSCTSAPGPWGDHFKSGASMAFVKPPGFVKFCKMPKQESKSTCVCARTRAKCPVHNKTILFNCDKQ